MFDHLLESANRDDSTKWSNIEFGEEITQVELIEVNFVHSYLELCILTLSTLRNSYGNI